MYSLSPKLLLILTAMLINGTLVYAQARTDPGTLERKELDPIQDVVKRLIRHVETFQEEILENLERQEDQVLYRRGDALLTQLVQLETALIPSVARKQIYKDVDQIEQKLQEMLKTVQVLEPAKPALKRQISQIDVLFEDLYFGVSQGDTTPHRTKKVIERQARVLVDSAQGLKRTANYALAKDPGRAVVLEAIRNLTESAERYRKNLAGNAELAVLRSEFAALTNAWKQVIQQLEALQPKENLYLLRYASRIDVVHARLYHLHGLEGKAPHLTIRS